MADVDDGYDTYYAERLWQLLPAVYRTADTDADRQPGRCASCSTASARRWPSSGAASTGCGPTSRSRPATTGSSRTSATCSARTWSPTSTPRAPAPRRRQDDPLPAPQGHAGGPRGAGAATSPAGRARRRGLPAAGPHPARPRPGRRAAAFPQRQPGRRRPAAADRGADRPADRHGRPADSPTCAPRTAPRSPARRSTRASTPPTSGPAAARSATSASPSCWCSCGG